MDYLHLIITDIVFETSEPIALHFVDQDVTDDFVDFLAQSPTIGIHSFATDSPSWQSVIEHKPSKLIFIGGLIFIIILIALFHLLATSILYNLHYPI